MTVAIDISHGKVLDQNFSAAFRLSNNSSLVGGCLFCIQELKSDQLPINKNRILKSPFVATVIYNYTDANTEIVTTCTHQLCTVMCIVKPYNHVDKAIIIQDHMRILGHIGKEL